MKSSKQPDGQPESARPQPEPPEQRSAALEAELAMLEAMTPQPPPAASPDATPAEPPAEPDATRAEPPSPK
jgi:hypothetical protein